MLWQLLVTKTNSITKINSIEKYLVKITRELNKEFLNILLHYLYKYT